MTNLGFLIDNPILGNNLRFTFKSCTLCKIMVIAFTDVDFRRRRKKFFNILNEIRAN